MVPHCKSIAMESNDIAQTRFKLNFGVLTRPDGSVLFSDEENVVLAGFYGPVEVKANKMCIDKATVEAHFRPKVGLPGVEDKFYENVIRNICEVSLSASIYPRTSVIIVIQEMHNSGELISTAINAACLAALDSGIEMKFMFAAVSCHLACDGSLHIKTGSLEKDKQASFVLVFDSLEGKIVASHTEGTFTEDQFKEVVSLCRKESSKVFNFFESALLSTFEK